ncbi:DUF3253 domain-containing protein [Roseococcus sp. SYP-B2431]|uniref:DUF3253 domain-containing protein n=1 Tax=Roseococcus sp. SYP-B2431 TaxID=2496640 RepID=UPI00103ED478|nr:DUF3253 domain-containing protein [Roseococcus sp. SYP-B2431]TCH97112.1 DUF3253 domain-containing protein [Roseococcus sp. SYP-B2431]
MGVSREAVEAEILARTAAAGAGASITPSEVAQGLAPEDWRPLLGPVRQAAARLAAAGRIEILRKGKPVPAEAMRGVIRLRRPAGTTE